jgi:uncharacterized protein YjbJ (UPF0337 family)
MSTNDPNANKDLGAQGADDTVKGTANNIAGKVQKTVGKVTGDKETEAKGKAREVGGTVQNKVGQAEQTVDNKLNQNP